MNNMRRGFTMIELIFVIVIIGILAAVAIPKLTANRDEAVAAVCKTEAAQLLTEMTLYYTKNGTYDNIDRVTNIQLGVPAIPNNGMNGVDLAPGAAVAGTVVNYLCNGEPIVRITQATTAVPIRGVVHNEFGLIVTDPAGQVSSSALSAANDLANQGFYKVRPGYVIGGN